jgi:DNA-binding MarR family transcriptional regulator
MIRRSNDSKVKLIAAIGDRVQAFQDATDEVDEAVAARLRINRTDLRCLGVLARAGSVSAGALADATGLTRGAMTTALDRLEAAGYVQRLRDQQDRRSVRLEMTASARQEVGRLYGPMATQGARILQSYTARDLAAILRYLEFGSDLQRAHARRIRELGGQVPNPTM